MTPHTVFVSVAAGVLPFLVMGAPQEITIPDLFSASSGSTGVVRPWPAD